MCTVWWLNAMHWCADPHVHLEHHQRAIFRLIFSSLWSSNCRQETLSLYPMGDKSTLIVQRKTVPEFVPIQTRTFPTIREIQLQQFCSIVAVLLKSGASGKCNCSWLTLGSRRAAHNLGRLIRESTWNYEHKIIQAKFIRIWIVTTVHWSLRTCSLMLQLTSWDITVHGHLQYYISKSNTLQIQAGKWGTVQV